MTGRLVVIAGPSGVGKSPLARALSLLHPDLTADMTSLVLYTSRRPRPGETDGVDYHFRSRSEIEALAAQPGYVGCEVRGDLQCLELATVEQILDPGRSALFEGNPFVPEALRAAGVFDRYPSLTVFLSPIGADELRFLAEPGRNVDIDALITDMMRRKLLRRTRRQKGDLSLPDLEDIERRATSAPHELRFAWTYDHVIVNHDGEDSENWDAFYYPVGDAFRTVRSLAKLLRGEADPAAERWSEDLLTA